MTLTPDHKSNTPIDISNMPPAPTNENVVVPPPEHRDDKHEKTTPWYRKPVALIGTGALAAAMVGGGIALSGKSRNAASQPKEPGAAAPADPTASASPVKQEAEAQTDFGFEPISAAELDNPANLAEFLQKIDEIKDNGGADETWAKSYKMDPSGPSTVEYAGARANKVVDAYIDTYFVSKKVDEQTQAQLDQVRVSATQTLDTYLTTVKIGDAIAYYRTYQITDLSVIKGSEEEGTISFVSQMSDNRLDNSANTMLKDDSDGYKPYKIVIEYKIVDGQVKFKSYKAG